MTMIESNYVNKLSYADIDVANSLKAAFAKEPQTIIDEITQSKLRGCGGAGFPTGLKLKFMTQESGEPKYVICNADEGEPGTFKDREIFTHYASLVFAGMAIAGRAIGASQGILYIRAEYTYLLDHLKQVLADLHQNEHFDFQIEIRSGAGAYICGEETALIESLEGKRGEPRNRPPFPIQDGYLHQPSEVNNVETFAWIAVIMQKGPEWFSSIGTEQSHGYKLFSISGDCKQPGVYEFPMGTTIQEMLKACGGEDAKAVQMGGASGKTIPARDFNRKIAFEDAPPGGSIMVFGAQRKMLDVAENFLEFFVEESCGQCTPCRLGNVKLLEGIRLLKQGECTQEYLEELKSLCETMKVASKCGLGQTSNNVFLSIVEQFPEELAFKGAK